MNINMFEGARRIVYSIMGIIVMTGIFIGFESEPRLHLYYTIPFPDKPIIKTEIDECGYMTMSETFYGTSPRGHSYIGQLCFKDVTIDGHALIPYKENGEILAAKIYSPQVEAYTKNFARKFIPPQRDITNFDTDYWQFKAKEFSKSLAISLLSAISFWVLCWLIGWIVRGFLGVPVGKDFKA